MSWTSILTVHICIWARWTTSYRIYTSTDQPTVTKTSSSSCANGKLWNIGKLWCSWTLSATVVLSGLFLLKCLHSHLNENNLKWCNIFVQGLNRGLYIFCNEFECSLTCWTLNMTSDKASDNCHKIYWSRTFWLTRQFLLLSLHMGIYNDNFFLQIFALGIWDVGRSKMAAYIIMFEFFLKMAQNGNLVAPYLHRVPF